MQLNNTLCILTKGDDDSSNFVRSVHIEPNVVVTEPKSGAVQFLKNQCNFHGGEPRQMTRFRGRLHGPWKDLDWLLNDRRTTILISRQSKNSNFRIAAVTDGGKITIAEHSYSKPYTLGRAIVHFFVFFYPKRREQVGESGGLSGTTGGSTRPIVLCNLNHLDKDDFLSVMASGQRGHTICNVCDSIGVITNRYSDMTFCLKHLDMCTDSNYVETYSQSLADEFILSNPMLVEVNARTGPSGRLYLDINKWTRYDRVQCDVYLYPGNAEDVLNDSRVRHVVARFIHHHQPLILENEVISTSLYEKRLEGKSAELTNY